ncbi:hypothetical protein [Psychrobacter sp.]|uniref:hypothetical protein n=1 Tax=Psychrobacter sp. TaxID=56811 RepID=UPI003C74153F
MSKPQREELNDNAWQKNDNGLFLPKNIITEKIDSDKKKKKTLRSYVEWAFDNISIVLLAPSFLGAVWQISELSSMNIAYIRFFSISQIPVDGTLILFLLSLILVMSKVIIAFVKHIFDNKMKMLEDKDKDEAEKIIEKLNSSLIKSAVINIILICSLIYMIAGLFVYAFPKSPIFTLLFLGFNITGLMIYVADFIILISLKILKDGNEIDDITDNLRSLLDKYKNYVLWSVLIGIALTILTVYSLLKAFSASFVLPANLYNTKTLESIVYKEFKTKDYNVEYFNDKYIFVQLCAIEKCNHRLEKEIVIYPTEKVLFRTTYGKVWTGYFTTSEPMNN